MGNLSFIFSVGQTIFFQEAHTEWRAMMISTDRQSWHTSQPQQAASSNHNVQFYESDGFLADQIGAFLREGLASGEGCIVIGTPEHRAQIERAMSASGVLLGNAHRTRHYISLDAATVLARFMVDGMPDPGQFAEAIGSIMARVTRGEPPRRMRVFGEMVALLWLEGNRTAALRLEDLWNDLYDSAGSFSLYCAYPMRGFAGESFKEVFSAICERHGHVLPTEDYASLASISERERAIALLQQKAASLEAEVAERMEAEERLRELEARKDAFIRMASHELKTPVTSIKAFTQILQRRMKTQADATTLALLNRMEAQLEKLTDLIGDLLDISKMQTGVLVYRDSCFDFDAMVTEIVGDVQAVTTTHAIRVQGKTGARVYGDRDRLGQVLINLLTNAVKYSPQADAVVVRLSAHAEPGTPLVEMAVQDFGPGIAEEYQAHIFERFYQVPEDVGGAYPGLGIGLYISREFVEKHNGRIWLESVPHIGSSFHVVLPCFHDEENGFDSSGENAS